MPTAEISAGRRLRLRFGLRSILALTVLFSLPLGWIAFENHLVANRRLLRIRAHKQLEKMPLGGYVVTGCLPANWSYENEHSTISQYRRWRGYPPEPVLFQIEARLPGFDDSTLEKVVSKLAECPDVEIGGACLINSQITDKGLRVLSQRRDIQSVTVGYDPCLDYEFLPPPVPAPNWPGMQITDQGISHLLKIKRLEKLRLYNTEITDAGLRELARMKNLRSIWLVCDELPIDDISPGPAFSESGVTALKSMVHLKELIITSAQLGDDDFHELCDALPHCNVHRALPGCSPRCFGWH